MPRGLGAALLIAGLGALVTSFSSAPAAAEAEKALPAPERAAAIGALDWGVFCALRAMDRVPAPDTLSGWLHVPEGQIDFHWPRERVVPAALGLAFGVKAATNAGAAPIEAEIRVYRPGLAKPDRWTSWLGETANLVFFRFDTEDELLTGLWRIEAWDGEMQLYALDFTVVPAMAKPQISQGCGATS